MDTPEGMRATEEKRRRGEDLYLTCAVDKEIAQARARRWDSGTTADWRAAKASPLEGVGAAISARAADR